jgi:hypothetical protein
MIHYHVWFSFKAGVAEADELRNVSAFLADLKTRSLIHDYRVQRARSSTPVLAPLHIVVSFADAEQFGRPFKEVGQIGIHAGLHGAMIQHVDKFIIDEFEDVS